VTRYVLTPIAEEDVSEIAAWIAGHNRIAAERFVDASYDVFEFLADHPAIGHYRRDLTDQPVRFWAIMRRYLIVYREATPVQILRVLSMYRDIATILR
jgi:plasmid stabilization system protein ParE